MNKNSTIGAITLITRADDCGSSHSANLGILQAIETGFLKNVSLMANCDFIEEAAEWLSERSDVCFGLHATLNAEWDQVKWGPVLPALKVPTLVDPNGMFLPSPFALAQQSPELDEIMLEFEAQLAKLRSLGFTISYIDTHMIPEYFILGMESRIMDWAQREGLLYWTRYCVTLKPVKQTEDLIEDMASRLQAAESGQYLYVGHPAVDSPEMRRTGNQEVSGELVAMRRVEEAKLFTDARILQVCQERGIVPIRYDEALEVTDKLPPAEQWLHA